MALKRAAHPYFCGNTDCRKRPMWRHLVWGYACDEHVGTGRGFVLPGWEPIA